MQVIKQKLTATCAQLTGYLHQPDTNAHQTNLPAIIIVPGGSYTHIPVAQAESLAMAFAGHGYQAFYLEYTLLTDQQPLGLAPVLDLGRAVNLLRQHAAEWHIDPQQITPAGFSVGGHIVALYNDYWATRVATELNVTPAMLKPNNVVLGYPVISPLLGFPKDDATLLPGHQRRTNWPLTNTSIQIISRLLSGQRLTTQLFQQPIRLPTRLR